MCLVKRQRVSKKKKREGRRIRVAPTQKGQGDDRVERVTDC